MLKNYFPAGYFVKTAFRNLTKNKMHSFINIAGLSAGMAVTLLIGLWINDELSFDKYHDNYNSIAQVMQNQTLNGEVSTQPTVPRTGGRGGKDGARCAGPVHSRDMRSKTRQQLD